MTESKRLSVIIPVHNEEKILHVTVPALLDAVNADETEVIFVCNGCSDRSAEVIAMLGGSQIRVHSIPQASKTQALNEGDRLAHSFPRFYVDADVIMEPMGFRSLKRYMEEKRLDLVSPKVEFDASCGTWAAKRIAQIWQATPHGKNDAFHHVLGLSKAGRRSWDNFPAILGDDAFIVQKISPSCRSVCAEIVAKTWAPTTFWAWVRVRARWERGHQELRQLGMARPKTTFQRRGVLDAFFTPKLTVGAVLYLACRFLSVIVAKVDSLRRPAWYHDRRGDFRA